jgi:hypothetical protein
MPRGSIPLVAKYLKSQSLSFDRAKYIQYLFGLLMASCKSHDKHILLFLRVEMAIWIFALLSPHIHMLSAATLPFLFPIFQ